MPANYDLLSSVCLGIALSACCGFRVFIPFLAASIAFNNNWIQAPSSWQWIGQWPAIVCFAVASAIEIGAYYITFLDNLLDTFFLPLTIIAAALLASTLIHVPYDEPLLRWGICLLAGGATAGTIKVGTGLVRLFTTKATVGAGNVLIASVENVAAVVFSILSFIMPVITASLLVILVLWIAFRSMLRVLKKEARIY